LFITIRAFYSILFHEFYQHSGTRDIKLKVLNNLRLPHSMPINQEHTKESKTLAGPWNQTGLTVVSLILKSKSFYPFTWNDKNIYCEKHS